MERQEAALLSEKRRLDNGQTLALPPAVDDQRIEPPLIQPIAMWTLSACWAPSALQFLGGIAGERGRATGRAAAAINLLSSQMLTRFSRTFAAIISSMAPGKERELIDASAKSLAFMRIFRSRSVIVSQCGSIDLVTASLTARMPGKYGFGAHPPPKRT
jgi:hypothetical protein